jgi:hypothetical protein
MEPSPALEPSPASDSPPRGLVFGLLGRVLAGLLLGLLLADYAAGRYDADRDLTEEGTLIQDPILGWTNKPGKGTPESPLSNIGLRNRNIPWNAPPAEVRVLGVGASRTFGSGVTDTTLTWGARLQGLLNKGHRKAFRVLNGGVKGYSALQSARRGSQLVGELDLDLVLLFISAGAQQMLDTSDAGQLTHVGELLVPRDVVEGVPDFLRPAMARGHKGLLHSNLYSRYQAQFTGPGVRPEPVKRYVLSRAEPPAQAAEMVRHTGQELRALATVCERGGVELRAVVMHEPYQTTDAQWKFWVSLSRAFGAPPQGTPREEPVRMLMEMLADAGIESFDMSAELDQIGADLETFTVDKRHWSRTGHLVMAYGIFERMRDGGLLVDLMDRRAASPRPVPTKR